MQRSKAEDIELTEMYACDLEDYLDFDSVILSLSLKLLLVLCNQSKEINSKRFKIENPKM
jgi:hypothetical protein